MREDAINSGRQSRRDRPSVPAAADEVARRGVDDVAAAQLTVDGGVLLLAGADKRLGLIDTLAAIIPDHRDPDLITHSMADILRARVFAIACGYPDADDLDDRARTRPSN